MAAIKYTIVDGKWFKNDKLCTQKAIKSELNLKQIEKLKKEKILNTRPRQKPIAIKKEEIKSKEIKTKATPVKETKKTQKQLKKDISLLNQYRSDYKVERGKRHGVPVLEVWRKNHLYGYSNFAFYLDDINMLDDLILKDIKEQKELKANKGVL